MHTYVWTHAALLLCAAQTIEYCDPAYEHEMVPGVTCQNLSFLDSIYFVCITIGTVGYAVRTADADASYV